MSEQENRLEWTGRPSHLLYLKDYLLCLLFFWLVFPVFVLLYKFLTVRTTTYLLEPAKVFRLNCKTSKFRTAKTRKRPSPKTAKVSAFN